MGPYRWAGVRNNVKARRDFEIMAQGHGTPRPIVLAMLLPGRKAKKKFTSPQQALDFLTTQEDILKDIVKSPPSWNGSVICERSEGVSTHRIPRMTADERKTLFMEKDGLDEESAKLRVIAEFYEVFD